MSSSYNSLFNLARRWALKLPFIVVLTAASWGSGNAADISASGGKFAGSVAIKGQIVAGDAKKLSELLANNIFTVQVFLDSPGGDVVEATRMAEVIRVLRLSTRVGYASSKSASPAPGSNKAICASACFFIWLAGSSRAASDALDPRLEEGRVGLHRPFLINPKNTEESLASQSNVVQSVTAYLDGNMVPRRLIDLMMSRPSNNIYWLSNADIEEIGRIRPDLEELYIARCGHDSKLNQQQMSALQRGDIKESDAIEKKLQEIMGCEIDLNLDAIAAGRKKLKSGWLPANPFQRKS